MNTYVQLKYIYRDLIGTAVLMLLAAMLTQAKADAQISPSQYELGKPFHPEITQVTCGGKHLEIISKFTPLNADHEIAQVSSQEIWMDRDGKKTLMARYRFDPQAHNPYAMSGGLCELSSGKSLFVTMLASRFCPTLQQDCSWDDYYDMGIGQYLGTTSDKAIKRNYHHLVGRLYRELPEKYALYDGAHPLGDINSIVVDLPTIINRRSHTEKLTSQSKVTYQSFLQCWDSTVKLDTHFFDHTVEQTLSFGMKGAESVIEIAHADAATNYLGGLICAGKNNNKFVEAWSWKYSNLADVYIDSSYPDLMKKDLVDRIPTSLVLRIFSLNGTPLATVEGNHIVPISSIQHISSLNLLGSRFFIKRFVDFWMLTNMNSMAVDGRSIDVGVNAAGKEWFDFD